MELSTYLRSRVCLITKNMVLFLFRVGLRPLIIIALVNNSRFDYLYLYFVCVVDLLLKFICKFVAQNNW